MCPEKQSIQEFVDKQLRVGRVCSLDQSAARGDFRLCFFFSKELWSFDMKIDNKSVANTSLWIEKLSFSYSFLVMAIKLKSTFRHGM